MLPYPSIDPVLFSIGPLHVRWYGLMYVIGFLAAYQLVLYQAKRLRWQPMLEHLDNLHLTLILGIIIGGRLGYVLFYNLPYYLAHPGEILAIWTGGMSFHGGCLGGITAGLLYCRRAQLDFWKAADLFTATVPVGLFLGRLGNFINGELFGRTTNLPWGMVFPEGGPVPRHPSQLYEALLEGVILFCILWSIKEKPWRPGEAGWPHGSMLAFFLVLYGFFRFTVEFVREPDPQVGLIGSLLSMGQILSLLMIGAGVTLWIYRRATANT